MSDSITTSLGRFVSGLNADRVPEHVSEYARLALLHNLSVAVAGGRLAAVTDRWSRARWGGSGARALISSLELSPSDAAFVNACLIHARAQDDTYFPGLTHVGAATVPGVLALGEVEGRTVGEVVLALTAGYEVAATLSVASAVQTTSYGFRASGIYGVFGAAAGAAKLLDLTPAESSNAIAIASSFAGGTNQTWVDGSNEWQLQLGAAARSGLEAAMLASVGAAGARSALEGDSGFFAAYARDASVAASVDRSLGRQWRTPDVTFKSHPVCAILQAPVDAAVELSAQADTSAFKRARLRLPPAEYHYPGTTGAAPFDDPGAALMSAAFCTSVALVKGAVVADDLFRSAEPGLLHASGRVDVVPDDVLGAREFRLEVELPDGRVLSASGDGGSARWQREELVRSLERLQPEVPEGIELDAAYDLVFGDGDPPVSELVDAFTCRGPTEV